jgi:perosamine synthetase
MLKRLPLSEPVISGNEWKYVKECLDSGWVSSAGEFVNRFSSSFAQYIGVKHAIPITNGTAALHVSLVALGLKADEEVIVPSMTFIATANVVKYCNAYPVFMDSDPETLCIDVGKTIDFIEKECIWSNNCLINKSTKRTVRGIIPVHVYGHPVDMKPLLEIFQKYNLFILEDATEALGAKYKGEMIGKLSQVSAFSFNGNKIITTGGGGMVVTDDDQIAERIRHLSTQARCDSREYLHDEIGYNYRLTNIQAALGLAQLEKLDEFIQSKRRIASFYQSEFGNNMDLQVCSEKEWAFSTYWLSWLLLGDDFGMSKLEILDNLNAQGIQARPLFIPLHLLPPYKDCQTYGIELVEKLYNKGINIPSHVELTTDELCYVTGAIKKLHSRGEAF